jgi:hypothetical protein
MKKILIALFAASCLLVSCSKQIPIDPINESAEEKTKNRVFLQVEAVYNEGGSDLSPVVSINL